MSRHRISGLIVAATLAACSVGELGQVLEPERGTGLVYELASVNGRALPAVVTEGNSSLEIRKGALTLAADSAWILSYVVRVTSGGAQQTTLNTLRGVYSLAVSALTLKAPDSVATQFTGTFSANSVALTDVTVTNGDLLVFNR
jgi:hypothetical protein